VVEFPTPNTTALSLSDGKTLIGGGADNKLYRLQYNLKQYLVGHTGPVRTFAFDQDDILSGGDDMTARRWKSWIAPSCKLSPAIRGRIDLALMTPTSPVGADTNCVSFRGQKTRSNSPSKMSPATVAIKHPAILRTVISRHAVRHRQRRQPDPRWDRRWENGKPREGGQILSLAALPMGASYPARPTTPPALWNPSVTEVHSIGSAQGMKAPSAVRMASGWPCWVADQPACRIGFRSGASTNRWSSWRPSRLARRPASLGHPSGRGLVAVGTGPELSLWNLTDLKKLRAVSCRRRVSGVVFFTTRETADGIHGANLMHYDVVKKGDSVELRPGHDSIVIRETPNACEFRRRTARSGPQPRQRRPQVNRHRRPRKVLTDAVGPVYSASYQRRYGRLAGDRGADGKNCGLKRRPGKIAAQAPLSQPSIRWRFPSRRNCSERGDDGSVRIWKSPYRCPNRTLRPFPQKS